jgi:hypothetical protein
MLQKSDFPGKVRYTWGEYPANVINGMKKVGIEASGVWYQVKFPGTATEFVDGMVFAVASEGQARKAYGLFVAQAKGDRRSSLQGLPKLGDEQLALYTPGNSNAGGTVLVRRGPVVWEVQVGSLGVLDVKTLQAEMQKYAKKQMTRVERG